MKYSPNNQSSRGLLDIILTLFFLTILSSCSSRSNNPNLPFEGIFGGANTKTSKIDSMEMVFVPAGEFMMGCDPKHNGGFECMSEELPLHKIYLDAYYIDQYEVTNAQYAKCVLAGACKEPDNDSSNTRDWYYGNPEFNNYPVVFIDWYSAASYCSWAGRRLPTEAEWEKAAHGTNTQAYPWGDEDPNCDLANMWNDATRSACVDDTVAVGSYPAGVSPYGAFDMAGNVVEWTSDWFNESQYSESSSTNPGGPPNGDYKIQRGGDWNFFWFTMRTTFRGLDVPEYADGSYGFRCASSGK